MFFWNIAGGRRSRRRELNKIQYCFDMTLGFIAREWKLKVNYSLDPEDIFDEMETKSFVSFEGLPKSRLQMTDGRAWFYVRNRFIEAWDRIEFKRYWGALFLKHPRVGESLDNAMETAFSRFKEKFNFDRTNCSVRDFLEIVGETLVEQFKSIVREYLGGMQSWNNL